MILKVCRYPVETLKSNVELSEFLYEYHYTLFKSFCKGYLEKEKKYSTAIKMLEKALKDENLKNSFTLNVMLFNAYVNTGSLDGIIHQAQKLLAFNFPDSD